MGALDQLRYLRIEAGLLVNVHWWRWVSIWFTRSFVPVASYRLDRACYLALGRGWPVARVVLAPVLFLARPLLKPCEIHYQAQIGPGLRILHPSLGVVISKHAVVGRNLVLTGGNCIGGRPAEQHRLELGDDVSLGAHAIVLSPVTVGDRVQVGAGAVVVDDAPADAVLIGIPARPVAASSTA